MGMGESIRRSSYIVALRAGVILVLAVLLAACGSGTTSGTSSEEPNEAGSETESTPPGSESREALPTVEPGVLTVALAGDAPYAMSDGEGLEGIDGDIINAIAGQLGLEVRPSLMDFSAGIESVSTGRVDMLIGGVGWSEERSEVMYLTDEIYYVNIAVAQQEGRGIQSFEDMDGLIGGSITGFSLVPELQAVPGVAEVRLYDTNDAVLRDVVEGRIDFALLDPFAVELAAQEHPDWGMPVVPDLDAEGEQRVEDGRGTCHGIPDPRRQGRNRDGRKIGRRRPRGSDQRRARESVGRLLDTRHPRNLRDGTRCLLRAAYGQSAGGRGST